MQTLETNERTGLKLLVDRSSNSPFTYNVLDQNNKYIFGSATYEPAHTYWTTGAAPTADAPAASAAPVASDAPAAIAPVLRDEEWTIEVLENLEQHAVRAAHVAMSDQVRADIVAKWHDSVAWLLAHDTRATVLRVAQSMHSRMH